MNYMPFALDDFSGGITDYPFTAPLNKAATLDNFIIDPNKKPIMRPGSELYYSAHPQLPSGQIRINTILGHDIENIFYVGGEKRMFYPNGTQFVELLGVGGVSAFNIGTSGSFSSFSEWNKQWYGVNTDFAKPVKIFKDESGVPQVRTAGLPKMAHTPTVAPVSGSGSFIWYFVFKYTYNVGSTIFANISSPIFVQMTNAMEPSVANPTVISNIPVLANSGGTSYDLTKITKQIYRTTNGGKAAYLVGEIANSVTTFSDNTNDISVVNNEALYTTGPNGTDGTLAYDEPPLAKYFHIMDGTGYYMHTKDSLGEYPFRIYQSTPDLIDSVPLDFFTDIRDDGKGISSYRGVVIAFGTTRTFRIDGQFDELGRGGMVPQEISKITGTISHNSIVQTEIGVFFAGNAGFYWTDGYNVVKVSDDINIRYQNMISTISDPRRIQGKYDALNLRIYWTAKMDTENSDNDTIFCLDLRHYSPGSRNASFTTFSNKEVFNPTAIGIYKNELIRGDFYGFVYRHSNDLSVDPYTQILKSPSIWGTKAIIWDLITAHLNFGIPSIRKWVSTVLLVARNYSNISIQPYSINDDSSAEIEMKEIRFRDSLVWGDPEATWGDPNISWLFQGLIEQKRRFPAGGLRCSYKQLRVTNAYTVITNSDSYTTATYNRTTKTLTLDDPTLSWLDDIFGYDIAMKPNGTIATDYTAILPIKSRDSNTQITLDDPTNSIAAKFPISQGYNFDSVKWLIKGFPKNEVGNLMSLIFYFAPLSPSQRSFYGTSSETGGNK